MVLGSMWSTETTNIANTETNVSINRHYSWCVLWHFCTYTLMSLVLRVYLLTYLLTYLLPLTTALSCVI